MGLVTEIVEATKGYGREFTLVIVLLSAFGVATKVVWENNTTRLNQQDARIEKSEEFIRTELLDLNKQSLDVTRKATDVMESAVEALDRNSEVMRRAVQ